MGCEAVKETPIEGVEHTVRLTFDCPFEMSDPRVTGSQPMECDEGFYDLTDLPGGVGVWDTCSMVLTGQGGTWKAVAAYGSEFLKSGILRTSGTNVYEGQGAFEGLRFVALFSASPELEQALRGGLPRRPAGSSPRSEVSQSPGARVVPVGPARHKATPASRETVTGASSSRTLSAYRASPRSLRAPQAGTGTVASAIALKSPSMWRICRSKKLLVMRLLRGPGMCPGIS